MNMNDTEVKKQKTSFLTFTVDSFADGIAFGQHRLEAGQDPRDFYDLKVSSEGEVPRLRSRYALHKANPLWELEKALMRLSRQGVLSSSTIHFGTTSDPFFPFEGKFDASMKFLQLFERYTPGLLVVQTRSPLLVIAMPVLKKLGNRAAVTIALETPLDDMVKRYTPGFTRVEERLRAATALRRFGVEVTMQVSPVLPYGDWKKDAAPFAQMLADHGDYVYVRSITDGSPDRERQLKASSVGKRLAQDRKFQWLRPDSANPLITALEAICPDKLKIPDRKLHEKRQLSIFAA
jgi:DNA repair photolyase